MPYRALMVLVWDQDGKVLIPSDSSCIAVGLDDPSWSSPLLQMAIDEVWTTSFPLGCLQIDVMHEQPVNDQDIREVESACW